MTEQVEAGRELDERPLSDGAGREDVTIGLERFFASMPTNSVVHVWNNERSFGFLVPYAEKGHGFGEISFSVNKETGAAYFDEEGNELEHCGQIIMRLVGQTVKDARAEAAAQQARWVTEAAERAATAPAPTRNVPPEASAPSTGEQP